MSIILIRVNSINSVHQILTNPQKSLKIKIQNSKNSNLQKKFESFAEEAMKVYGSYESAIQQDMLHIGKSEAIDIQNQFSCTMDSILNINFDPRFSPEQFHDLKQININTIPEQNAEFQPIQDNKDSKDASITNYTKFLQTTINKDKWQFQDFCLTQEKNFKTKERSISTLKKFVQIDKIIETKYKYEEQCQEKEILSVKKIQKENISDMDKILQNLIDQLDNKKILLQQDQLSEDDIQMPLDYQENFEYFDDKIETTWKVQDKPNQSENLKQTNNKLKQYFEQNIKKTTEFKELSQTISVNKASLFYSLLQFIRNNKYNLILFQERKQLFGTIKAIEFTHNLTL